MRHGLAALVALFCATFVIVGNAFYQKKQFFPTVVYLTKYRPLFAVILIQCLTFLVLAAKSICWLFFGTLQRAELDTILSRSWYTFFDMCLVFAFFQDELNTKFMFLFTIILFVKAFHWLLEERIDHMERTPIITASFHIRLISFIVLLTIIDVFHIAHFYWGTSTQFLASLAVGAEYYILLFGLLSSIMRYILQTIDSLRDSPWDRKSMYLLYVDIFVGLLRTCFYLEFTPILWSRHPFPLFIVRPIYLNFRFLRKTVRDLLLSRRAIRLMNTVFQDVTIAELASSSDTVCIICREDMHATLPASDGTSTPGSTTPASVPESGSTVTSLIKRLPCSHIFHAACLRSWFQRQQTCPTCRMNVLRHLASTSQRHVDRSRPQANQTLSGQTSVTATVTTAPPSLSSTGDTTQASPVNIFQSSPSVFPGACISGQPFLAPFVPPSSFMGPPILIPGGSFFPGLASPMPIPPATLTEPPDEAKLRASVEARMTSLRQIHTLLDAAIIQLNAYTFAVSSPDFVGASLSVPEERAETSPAVETGSKNVTIDVKSVPVAPQCDGDELAALRRCRLEKLINSSSVNASATSANEVKAKSEGQCTEASETSQTH